MARIKNTDKYSIKEKPSLDDYFPASDSENDGKTINLTLRGILELFKEECGCGGSPSQPLEIISFQFSNLTDDISNISLLTDAFLDANGTEHVEQDLLDGKNITLSAVGRFGFVIKNAGDNPYQVFDVLNNDVTTILFDSSYDSANNIFYFVTKEYLTPSTLYYKFVKN